MGNFDAVLSICIALHFKCNVICQLVYGLTSSETSWSEQICHAVARAERGLKDKCDVLSKWSESDRAFGTPTLSFYTAIYIGAGFILLPQQGAQLIITLFQRLLANTTTQPWLCFRLALYLCKSSEVNYNYNNYFVMKWTTHAAARGKEWLKAHCMKVQHIAGSS